jgi:cytoskeletal protein RodZ
MKRCPQCASGFSDTVHFCEFDGARLVADYLDSDDPALPVPREEQIPQTGTSAGEVQLDPDYLDSNPDLAVPVEEQSPQTTTSSIAEAAEYQLPLYPPAAQSRQNSQILSLIILAGVVAAVGIGLVLFIGYQRMTYEARERNSNESSNVALTQQQVPLLPERPSSTESSSPSPEPSPSPSPIASPAAQAESARGVFSSSQVSTGGNEKTRRGPVTIRLTNGTSVEADEAWETGEGIWYRRSGVVSLLERDQVQAIEKSSPASSPAATPATSPSATP